MGRWMSPDWADKPEAVLYSDLADPQSLNLYGYVRNNPLSKADPDGHQCSCQTDEQVLGRSTAEFIDKAVAATRSAFDVGKIALATVAAIAVTDIKETLHLNEDAKPAPAAPTTAPTPTAAPAAPALPTGIVGVQDGKSGPQGNRHNSGPLAPEHGGTGDATADFGRLTGGQSAPAPQGSTYPPGTQLGENGTALRPQKGRSGPRIDNSSEWT